MVERLGEAFVDTQVVEQIGVGGVPAHPLGKIGGNVGEVARDRLPGVLALHDQLLEVLVEDVTDDADRKIRLAVHQRGGGLLLLRLAAIDSHSALSRSTS